MLDLMEYCIQTLGSVFNFKAIKTACAVGFSVIFYFLGDHIASFIALTVLIALDLLMAMIVIVKKDLRLQSGRLRHTAVKWLMYWILVSAAVITERILHVPFIAATMIGVLGATELISVLEHASVLGFIIPVSLFKNLRKIQNGEVS